MEETEVVSRIAGVYAKMSPSQQRIADVILHDPESVAFFNVAELARAANVSDSSVTRFAIFLGYTGYPGLSQDLQARVRMRLTTRERLERSRLGDNRDPEAIYYTSLADDLDNMNLLLQQLDFASLQRAVALLENAQKIGIICSRSAISLGHFFDFYLNILGKPSMLLTGEPRTTDQIYRLSHSDVVVGIGFSRYSWFTVKSLMYCQEVDVPTVALTDYPTSPLVRYADVALFCPTGIASHMDSFVAPLALIQAILRGMSRQESTAMIDNLRKLEGVWAHFNIYLGSDD